ncbi:MAG: penicillin-binding protein 2 [Candidatus Berkelbacteria bacterium]|nr:penicillin-binding protein 2 [Candidatus Berkelbacteria bacterium]
MQQNINRPQDKRIKYLGILFFLLGVIFVGRLFQRQIITSGQYTALADKQYYTKIDQPAKRGDIFIQDKDNQNLIDESKTGLFTVANDLELYSLTLIPKNITDKRDAANKIAPIISEDQNAIFEKINNNKLYIPPLKKHLSKEDADKIAALNLKGVFLEGEYSRFYPENSFLSQVLGFVDYGGNGKYGAEEYFDGVLKGEGGVLKGLKDNLGRVIKIQQNEPGKDGSSVVLTIDRSVQYMAEKKLKEGIEKYGADAGSIVIMDPKTGAILAMASSPDYDPNKFNEVKTDQQSIFINPITASNWEPGSIFKPIITAAGLEGKFIEPDSKPSPEEGGFSNKVNVGGYEIHNSQDKSFGFESVTQILENSDNIGMIWVANKIGNDFLGEFIKKMGFGIKTGIDLSGESSGQVSSYKTWKDVNRATISFGQGISVTPLQIAQAYSTIADKGSLVKPHILDKVISPDGKVTKYEPETPIKIMSEENAKKDTDMMISVVENGHGKKAKVEGFKVAGKTGTAQIPKPGGGYEENQHIGSFAGFAPADDPRFVMLVKLDHPQNVEWAESSAAPIFGEIADWLLNSYLKVPKQNQ